MDFLPVDYKIPETSNYMKFAQGENRFRIISKPIIGYEFWVTEGESRKPVRRRMNEEIQVGELEDGVVKHFWAFVVYNFDAQKIQILELTQKGLMKSVTNLGKNKKWGSPLNYNLVVTKTGEKMATEYQITPEPTDKKEDEFIKDIKIKAEKMNINLEALYTGDDPFAAVEEDNSTVVEDALRNIK